MKETTLLRLWILPLLFLACHFLLACEPASDEQVSNASDTAESETESVDSPKSPAPDADDTEQCGDDDDNGERTIPANDTEHEIGWLQYCETEEDCEGVTECFEGICAPPDLPECDRSMRGCRGRFGVECSRFGVPLNIFRCEQGFLCESDPIKERCQPIECNSSQRSCRSRSEYIQCTDDRTNFLTRRCSEDGTCLNGDCVKLPFEHFVRTCAQGELLLTTGRDALKASVKHCSNSQRCDYEDNCVCEDNRCTTRGCRAGVGRCLGDLRSQQCDASGSWAASVACTQDETCVAGECVAIPCGEDSEATCRNGQLVRCEDGGYEIDSCEFGCDEDQPARCREPSCTPGALSCADEDTVSVCNRFGSPIAYQCPETMRCHEGACVYSHCEPGTRRCNGSAVEACSHDGTRYQTEVVCDSWEVCHRSECIRRDELGVSPDRFHVVCRIAETDRWHSDLSVRRNFPVICRAQLPSSDADLDWKVFHYDPAVENRPTNVASVRTRGEETVSFETSETGAFAVTATATQPYGAKHFDYALVTTRDPKPLVVQLAYESSLPGPVAIGDSTNLNLFARTPNESWFSESASVSYLYQVTELPMVGAVHLERFADRPGGLEYMVFDDPETDGTIELGVLYFDGVHPVRPRLHVYRGTELVDEVAGPELRPARFSDETCRGQVWLAGTLNTRTGRVSQSSRVEPTFPGEESLSHCYGSDASE